VYINSKSFCINSVLFLKWFREHFIPRKTAGKCLLILVDHASHCSASELLELADPHDIIVLCSPSHNLGFSATGPVFSLRTLRPLTIKRQQFG
jgi:hypothetical protein